MIYLDSSVVLSQVYAEPDSPHGTFWLQEFVSSKLLEYEVLNRVNQHSEGALRNGNARMLIDNVELIALSPIVLSRALGPFPVAVKTFDGLHLATMDYLRAQGQTFRLASYDKKLVTAAQAIGVEIETNI